MADDDGVVRIDGVGLRVEGLSNSAVSLQVAGTQGGAGDVVLSLKRAEHVASADPLRARAEVLNSQSAEASIAFQKAAAPPMDHPQYRLFS